jgi:SAM-dependent methyltransferase
VPVLRFSVCKTPRRVILDRQIEEASRQLKGTVLDLGSAESPYASLTGRRLPVDIRPFPGVKVLADAGNLPFKDSSLSSVLCTELLEHILEPERVVSELHRILLPGGILILTAPFLYPIHRDPVDFHRFTEDGLRAMLQDFQVLSIIPQGKIFTVLGLMVHVEAETYRLPLPLKLCAWLMAHIIAFFDTFIPQTGWTTGYLVICKR